MMESTVGWGIWFLKPTEILISSSSLLIKHPLSNMWDNFALTRERQVPLKIQSVKSYRLEGWVEVLAERT